MRHPQIIKSCEAQIGLCIVTADLSIRWQTLHLIHMTLIIRYCFNTGLILISLSNPTDNR